MKIQLTPWFREACWRVWLGLPGSGVSIQRLSPEYAALFLMYAGEVP
jgi:hypothetical protein